MQIVVASVDITSKTFRRAEKSIFVLYTKQKCTLIILLAE